MRFLPKKDASGPVVMELDIVELRVLEWLPERLRTVLLDPAEAPEVIDRLFPPAFPDDPDREAEHRALLGRSLFDRRLEALQGWESTLERVEPDPVGVLVLAPDEVDLWLHVVNDLRLLFSTRLGGEASGCGNDEEPPEGMELDHALLDFLTWLQQGILESLSGSLDDPE